MLRVILGGAKSGKSRLALEMASRGATSVTFVATAEIRDSEMKSRIERHRLERPSHWITIEEPISLDTIICAGPPTVTLVVDCVTLWVSNLIEAGLTNDEILSRVDEFARVGHERVGDVIVVTNEVGLGIVPVNDLARRYRDVLGEVNAALVSQADEAWLVVAGRLLALSSVKDLA